MQEIADFCGVGRTTVYRHFPSREKLFEALMGEVMERSRTEIAEITAAGREAEATIRAVGMRNVELGVRFRFVYDHPEVTMRPIQTRTRVGDSSAAAFLQAAQDRGEVRSDLPVRWMTALVLSLTMAMVGDVLAGRIGQREGGEVLGETLATAFLAD